LSSQFAQAGKPIAAICHAAQILTAADVGRNSYGDTVYQRDRRHHSASVRPPNGLSRFRAKTTTLPRPGPRLRMAAGKHRAWHMQCRWAEACDGQARVADLLVDFLAEAGVQLVYGVAGDWLNGITDSIRAKKRVQWIHVRHEETVAFAAGAEAHLTGRLAVCAGS
jgi:hypothetical protein